MKSSRLRRVEADTSSQNVRAKKKRNNIAKVFFNENSK